MSKKRAIRTSHTRETTQAMRIKFLFLGALSGLSVGGLAVIIVSLMDRPGLVPDSQNFHPATYTVAEKFLCGCSDCVKELADCDCSETSGGVYERQFISGRLNEGMSQKQVISLVQEKFGKIKK